MEINGTLIEDTFAEAFRMQFARITITALDDHWLAAATRAISGYGTSVIGCDAEVGVECLVPPNQTIDSRIGASVLLFGFTAESLGKAILARVGQCVMTCPTTMAYDGNERAETKLAFGRHLRFFGDGFQKSKLLGNRRFWRIPVMDGEFVIEDTVGIAKGVAGGNFLIQSVDQQHGLAALRRAISAIENCPGVITPFPGGAVRSGSKIGSRYPNLKASTAHQYCPTLRGRVESSRIHPSANCVYEIVIDGVDELAIELAMQMGIHAAAGNGIVSIGAGNYGGKLGKFHFRLHDILSVK